MIQLRRTLAILCAVSLLGLAAAALATADEKKKEKSKGAKLDDATAMLTETVDGKEKTSKLDLKYCLKVKGYFADDGFHLDEVDAGGPAFKLNGGQVMLEKGDIITEVDGKKIKSAQDYAKAMNAADPANVKLKVRDINSGQEMDFTAEAEKR